MSATVAGTERHPWITHDGSADEPVLAGARILFVVNVDWFFLSHRLPLARAARELGAEVCVASTDTGQASRIRDEGLAFHPITFSRKGSRLSEEASALFSLASLYRRVRPDLVHHVTIKPVLYGSLAARAAAVPCVVNAITGLGTMFSSEQEARRFHMVIQHLYRIALGRGCAIFQNPDDRELMVDQGIVAADRTVLIRGSGVDCDRFVPTPPPPGRPVVVLPSRMLWDKGVGTFVEAARLLRDRGCDARFVLAGAPDDGNPTMVPEACLRGWNDEGVVEWWGHQDDMPSLMARASVVTLPTFYKEGVPKVLLEAAAAGRPIVASDIPGCREIVRDGENGTLVPAKSAEALATAIGELLASPQLRKRYGEAGRRIALNEFTEGQVARQTMRLYHNLLHQPGAPLSHLSGS